VLPFQLRRRSVISQIGCFRMIRNDLGLDAWN